jgi:glycosyltransferase involved in cell wall biosynthesis
MITAIVATYNHARFLEKCITAISAQGDLISKIIVVNDASTDNTLHVLDEIKARESRLLVVTNKVNLGTVGGFKTGLQYVETDFFAFFAADDFLMPDWATSSVKAMRLSVSAAVCLSNTYIKDEDTGFITCSAIPNSLSGRWLSPERFRKSVMKYGVWYSSNTALFRTSTYNEDTFRSDLGPLNDRLMISALGSRSGVVVVDKRLGCFYIRSSSLSGSVASRNMSFQLLNSFSDFLFRSDLFLDADRKFTNKVFLSTFYIYVNEHLEFLLHQYKNVLCDVSDKRRTKVIVLLLSFLIICFKVVSSLAIKSLPLILHERFLASKLPDQEVKYVNDYENRINSLQKWP